MKTVNGVDAINQLRPSEAYEAFQRCCGAHRWAEGMVAARPFANPSAMLEAADRIWAGMNSIDIMEAFQHHPRIGDIESLRKKFASTAAWASQEQSGTASADEATLQGLADGNRAYEAKFGYIFIVCATGKTAGEMLSLLQQRLPNDPAIELTVAAEEQRKITQLRLEKLVNP